MNRAKNYSLPEVFNNVSLGFTFEFYSSKATPFIVENLANLTMKNVILTNGMKYEPSYSQAILIKEYEGKKPRYSFTMAQQRYESIIPLMKEVLGWISETSQTTHDTVMRVNMSFDHKHLHTLNTISKMNPQKLILKIDEDYIYDRFPDQQFSPYSISIKQMLPISEAVYTPDLIKNVNYIIGVPKNSYYGINFKEFTRGILEFNYIGGMDYPEKQKEILEIIQYYVIKTYQSLNENEFSKEEIKELKELTEEFNKIQEAYYEPVKFRKLFENIKVMVDLKPDEQIIKSYWPQIRNTLFETVINQKLREGEFNYDTTYGVYQLRKANIECTNLKGFDLVLCEASGIMRDCNFISCEVDNARIYNSKVVKGTEIRDSYLNKVTVDKQNVLDGCFVENQKELLNCDIKESIIKFAGIGDSARLDESTVIIDDQVDYKPAVGIEVEEIRDYKWFKDLLGKKSEDHTFGNEYKKKTYI
jgi:hypothetical protein